MAVVATAVGFPVDSGTQLVTHPTKKEVEGGADMGHTRLHAKAGSVEAVVAEEDSVVAEEALVVAAVVATAAVAAAAAVDFATARLAALLLWPSPISQAETSSMSAGSSPIASAQAE